MQHLLFVDLFNDGHSDKCGVIPYSSCDLIAALFCISLITNEVEQLFICLFVIHMSSLEKFLFRFSAQYLGYSFFYIELMSCLYISEINSLSSTYETAICLEQNRRI